MGTRPERGKTYDVLHVRKGRFRLLVTGVSPDGEFVDGQLVAGRVVFMASPDAVPGDQVSLRISLCELTEVGS